MTRERKISNETAINELEMLKEDACDELQEMAIDMAIEALRQGDTESLVIAGDYIEHNGEKYIKLSDVEKSIDRWERQERPKGRWIRKTKHFGDCSECGENISKLCNFCPNCGAEMER